MHPYLTKLGVRIEVQEFFSPFYRADVNGNLVFDYEGETETYGFAFHRVPLKAGLWIAGQINYRCAQQVLICGSAMDAISFLHFRYPVYVRLDGLIFIAIGSRLNDRHLQWINSNLAEKKYALLFGSDFLGKLADLKIAAGIRRIPVTVWQQDGLTTINFRHQNYTSNTADFSLNTIEKLTGYRFGIRTVKPKGYLTFFDQLKAGAF